jgi:hypothetical protein
VAETNLNITVALGRLDILVPDGWRVEPHLAASAILTIEGEANRPDAAGPPLRLRLLGLAGVVAVERIARP